MGWEAVVPGISGVSHIKSSIYDCHYSRKISHTERETVSIEEESRPQEQNIGQRTRSRPQAAKLKLRARLSSPRKEKRDKGVRMPSGN